MLHHHMNDYCWVERYYYDEALKLMRNQVFEKLVNNKQYMLNTLTEFPFKEMVDPLRKMIDWLYPKNWNSFEVKSNSQVYYLFFHRFFNVKPWSKEYREFPQKLLSAYINLTQLVRPLKQSIEDHPSLNNWKLQVLVRNLILNQQILYFLIASMGKKIMEIEKGRIRYANNKDNEKTALHRPEKDPHGQLKYRALRWNRPNRSQARIVNVSVRHNQKEPFADSLFSKVFCPMHGYSHRTLQKEGGKEETPEPTLTWRADFFKVSF